MSKKPYFETHRIIKFENDPAGKKRVWVEVAEGEALMLKFKAGTKADEIEAAAAAKLQALKDRQALEDELAALEAEAELLRQQLENGG
jgi:hypothetical protein